MVAFLYLFINGVELFLLATYLLLIGSSQNEQVFLNLSPLRLVTLFAIIIIGSFFFFLSIKSLSKKSKITILFMRIANNESLIWTLILLFLSLSILLFFALTRQPDFYGNFQVIFERFEPIIVWGHIVSLQTGLFLFIWLAFFPLFIKKNANDAIKDSLHEFFFISVIFIIAIVYKFIFISPNFFGPTIIGDEIKYFDMAESMYRGFFSISETHHYPPLYSIFLFPSMIFGNRIFEAIKVINVLLSTSIVFPLFLISRHFLNLKKSLAISIISLLTAYHLFFSGHLLSENLFVPLFFWVVYFTFTNPKELKHRILWDLANGILIGCLYMTRYITLVIIPLLIISWWIKPFENEKNIFALTRNKLIHFSVFCVSIVLTFAPWGILAIKEGLPIQLALGFGIASNPSPEQLTIHNFLIYFFLYFFYSIILASTEFNLFAISFFTFNFKKWNRGFQRLLIQITLILAGFLIATARHSWRAYYNSEIASRIMGRYLVAFVPLFILISFVMIEKFKKPNHLNLVKFLFIYQVIPLLLIGISYISIFNGKIIPSSGNILLIQDSVDGYFVKLFGPIVFWSFIIALSAATNISLWFEKKITFTIQFIGLVMYFIIGTPLYIEVLQKYQTYPWIASQVINMHFSKYFDVESAENISIVIPNDATPKEISELWNRLRMGGIIDPIIVSDANVHQEDSNAESFFLIQHVVPTELSDSDAKHIFEFNDRFYLIEAKKTITN